MCGIILVYIKPYGISIEYTIVIEIKGLTHMLASPMTYWKIWWTVTVQQYHAKCTNDIKEWLTIGKF